MLDPKEVGLNAASFYAALDLLQLQASGLVTYQWAADLGITLAVLERDLRIEWDSGVWLEWDLTTYELARFAVNTWGADPQGFLALDFADRLPLLRTELIRLRNQPQTSPSER